MILFLAHLTEIGYSNHMAKEISDTTEKIARQIRLAVAEKSIAPSNEKLARETGLASMSIGRYLKGERAIPMPAYIALCAALDIDPVEIMRLALDQ